MNKSATFMVSSGFTRNITTGPTHFKDNSRFCHIDLNPVKLARCSLEFSNRNWKIWTRFMSMANISCGYTRGIVCPPSPLSWQWILFLRYRVASFHFVMAVDPIPEVSCGLLPLCQGSGSYIRGIVCPPSTLSWQ